MKTHSKVGYTISKDNEKLDLYVSLDLIFKGLAVNAKAVELLVIDSDGVIVDEYDIDEAYMIAEKYTEVIGLI